MRSGSTVGVGSVNEAIAVALQAALRLARCGAVNQAAKVSLLLDRHAGGEAAVVGLRCYLAWLAGGHASDADIETIRRAGLDRLAQLHRGRKHASREVRP